MTNSTTPKIAFYICTIALFGLLGSRWFIDGDMVGFFLTLFIICMQLMRHRMPALGWTSIVDVLVCIIFMPFGLVAALFFAMYYGVYIALLAAIASMFFVNHYIAIIITMASALGLLLRFWETELNKRLFLRDEEARRYYQLEELQDDIVGANSQIERMSAISERARISREIHDNAGHEIIAAYMSLQTARTLFEGADEDALELYDTALARMESGITKIREAVHNISTVTAIGIESLQEVCIKYPKDIEFIASGDTRHVPVHVWNVLESCLNEGLTNISKHALPQKITVEVDTTSHIVRLCIENDGTGSKVQNTSYGTGLRNIRFRLNAIGGSVTVTPGDGIFRMVCVAKLETSL